MRAILGYIYAKDKWTVVDISCGALSVGPEVYERCYTGSDITEFIEIPITNARYEDGRIIVTHKDGVKLPHALTLEESIQENIRILTPLCGKAV